MGALSAARIKGAGASAQDDPVVPDLAPEAAPEAPVPAAGEAPAAARRVRLAELRPDPAVDIPDLPPEAPFIAAVIAADAAADAASPPATDPPQAPNSAAQALAHEDLVLPAPEAHLQDYLAALDRLIQRIGPSADQATTLASPEAQEALQQLRGMTAGALALGLRSQIAGVFTRYGRPGERLLAAALANASPGEAIAQTKPGRAPTRPDTPPAPAQSSPPRGPGGGAGGGGGGSGLGSALAKLIAAPVTVPAAAGSRIWQALTNRFGPRPAIPANIEAFDVVKNQFDDACNRAIDKISHIRSGPMNPHLSEMVANPLKIDEQFQRMAVDEAGEFHERAQRMKEALGAPAVQRDYAALNETLDELQYRGRRLAEAGRDTGNPVEDLIATRVDEVARKAEGLPALDADGKLNQFQETIRELVEKIQEFLRSLFSRPAPAT